MYEVKISALSEYLKHIENFSLCYPVGRFFNNPTDNPFLFRGLCDSKYELLPSVFRECRDTEFGLSITNAKYLEWNSEKGLLQAFIHEASGTLSIPPNDLGHWAEYAQHYGVPTRFLDWTSNPLVALYFACRDKTDSDGTVWLIHPCNYKNHLAAHTKIPQNKTVHEIITGLFNDEFDCEYPLIYTPYYTDKRMSAQKSYFMVWGNRADPLEKMFSDKKYRMTIPDANSGFWDMKEFSYENFLTKFYICADCKQPLLHQLNTVGINEKTLFPGLDGIGRYVERQYRFDYNEAKDYI